MREKRRYLLLKLGAEGGRKFSAEEAKQLVYEAVFSLLGEEGAASAGVQLKEFDPGRQLLVVKAANKGVDKAIAALAAKTEFRGGRCCLRLQGISGAIGRLLAPSAGAAGKA